MPAPTILALIAGIVVATGSSSRDAAEFAAWLLVTLLSVAHSPGDFSRDVGDD